MGARSQPPDPVDPTTSASGLPAVEAGSCEASPSCGPRRDAIAVALLTLLAAVLRLLSFQDFTLRGDEFGTLQWVQASVADIMTHYELQLTMHSYILALKAWSAVAGLSPLALKAPSIVAGVALVPALYLVARKWVGPDPALLAAAMVALNGELIRQSQNARAYAVLLLVVVVAMGIYHAALERGRRRDVLLLALIGFLGLTLSLNFVYVLACQGAHSTLWWLADRPARRKRFVQLVATFLVVGVLAVGFYFPVLDEIATVREKWTGTGSFRLDWVPETVDTQLGAMRWPLLCFALVGAIALLGQRRAVALFLLPWGLLPWALHTYDYSYPAPVYSRYVLPALPALLLLMSAGILVVLRPLSVRRRGLALVLGGLIATGGELTSADYWSGLVQGSGRPYRQTLERIAETAATGDVVVEGLLGTERPQLLTDAEGMPPFLEMASVSVDSERLPLEGKLYVMTRSYPSAESHWAQRFTVEIIGSERTSLNLTLLVGPAGSAAPKELRNLLRHYLRGCLLAAESEPLDGGYRHYRKLAQVYKSLLALSRDPELSRSYRQKYIEARRLCKDERTQ